MADKLASRTADNGSGKIPVTIVTGFLGSGKTTLINYILSNKGQKTIAVLENEFGEVNVDSKLVSDNLAEEEDVVSLDNGCVCCSLRKDIVRALAEIDRRSQLRKRPVHAVLLETTGLADPAPVAFTFFANPWIASKFRLDSMLCVVDARYILQHLDIRTEGLVNEAAQQVAFADLIMLNKTDLVSPGELENVKYFLRHINSTAEIVHCQLNGSEKPPVEKLLNGNGFSLDRALKVDPTFLDSDSEQDDDSGPSSSNSGFSLQPYHKRPFSASAEECSGSCAECSKPSHLTQGERVPKRRRKKMHDLSDICSVGIVATGALDEYRFNMFMRDLLHEKAKDIYRCKGVLCIQGYGNAKFVFQGVHETIQYGPACKPWTDDEPKVNQIVFIGKNLNQAALVEGFRTCVWVPLPEGWQEFRDQRTNTPYYYNTITKERTWVRPEYACPRVTSQQIPAHQPRALLPRKASTLLGLDPAASMPSPLPKQDAVDVPAAQQPQQALEAPTMCQLPEASGEVQTLVATSVSASVPC